MWKNLTLVALITFSNSLTAWASTLSLKAVADTSLFESDPDNNLGLSELAAGTTAQGLRSRALIWFDVSGKLPSGATITAVSLKIQVTKTPPGGLSSTFGIHRMLQDWAEGLKSGSQGAPATADETTWNARLFPSTLWGAPGAASGSDYVAKASSSTAISGIAPYTFASTPDLISDVRTWIATPKSNFGWILISQSETTPRTAKRFGSSEDPATAPELVIEYSTQPAAAAPAISAQPQSQSVAAGSSVSFTVNASGTAPLSFQWRFNGVNIPNATSATLTLNNVQAASAGSYTVVVSNSAGSITSAAASLSVLSASRNRWTILIYGHADHNLSASLVADMQEMEAAGSGPDFNVVLQADFDASSDRNAAAGLPANLATGVTRFLIRKDNDPNTITSAPLERLPELNMDDPKVLTDFIAWGAQKYPADRYGLILWNHGGQWQGFGGDSQDGTLQDRGVLSTAQIRQAVTAAMKTGGIAKWDFISFDTCLMGGAEVLADFVPMTDVFMACPEIDYGDGWDYEATFNFLKSNPSVSALDFGRAEVKAWEAQHMQLGKDSDLALAAHALYDLTKYAAFEEKFNAFATLLGQSATPQNVALPRLRLDTTQYSLSDVKDIGKPTDFIDLGELADRLIAGTATDAALHSAAASLIGSIDSMVVARVRGEKKQQTHSLSVYYPIGGAKDNSTYAGLTLSSKPGSAWSQFLAKVTENKLSDELPPELAAADVGPAGFIPNAARPTFSASISQPANLRVKIVTGTDAYAMFASVVDNHFTGKTNEYVYLGEVLNAPVKGTGAYNVPWNGTLPMLSNTAGTNAAVLGGFFDDVGSDILVSFAEYKPPGSTDTQIVALLTQINGNKGEVIEVLDAEVEELAPEGIDVEAGGTLTPLYYLERRQGNDPEKWESDDTRAKASILIPSNGLQGLTINMAQLPTATYTVEVQVVDAYENESDVLEYFVSVGASTAGPVIAVQSAPGKITISWSATTGDYSLESNTTLTPGGWTAVAPGLIATVGGNKTFVEAISGPTRFYRLKKN